ncbi:MAG: hypothetical protein WAM14_13365 [Candidatus Nitrosopolaris sp.]
MEPIKVEFEEGSSYSDTYTEVEVALPIDRLIEDRVGELEQYYKIYKIGKSRTDFSFNLIMPSSSGLHKDGRLVVDGIESAKRTMLTILTILGKEGAKNATDTEIVVFPAKEIYHMAMQIAGLLMPGQRPDFTRNGLATGYVVVPEFPGFLRTSLIHRTTVLGSSNQIPLALSDEIISVDRTTTLFHGHYMMTQSFNITIKTRV